MQSLNKIVYQSRIFIVIIFFLFIVQNPLSATTYYFSVSGLTTNNGLSAGTPKLLLSDAIALMKSGNTILFKRGEVWYIPGRTIDLSGKSSFTINAYGTGEKPVFAGMGYLNGNWIHTGNAVWKCTDTFQEAHRVFVNGISRINLAHKADNSNSLTDLDQTDEYYYGKKTLYLKTTSTTVAPTGVEIIPAIITRWNGFEVMKMKNTSNVTIKNIEFRGGSVSDEIYIEAPCSNIVFDHCVIGRANRYGIRVTNPLPNANVVNNITITNCVVDKGWTVAENNLKPFMLDGKGKKLALRLAGDGISLWHGVKNGLISGNVVSNWGHEGIALNAFLSKEIYGVRFIKIENNDVSGGNSGYMHAFSLNGISGKLTNNIIKRNYFHHYTSGCNITGDMNFIFSNIFSDVAVSKIKQHLQSPMAGNISTWFNGKAKMVARDNFICNNTFYSTDTYALLFRENTGDTTGISGNRIYNNIMMEFGRNPVYQLNDGQFGPPTTVAIRVINSVGRGLNYFRNNNFWPNCGASYCDTTSSKNIVMYGNTSYTIANFNDCGKCGQGKSAGNVQLNPRFKDFFKLTRYSAATLRSGGYNYKAIITGAGLPPGEFVDYYGRAWPAGPSMGAIQYVNP